MSTVFLLAKGRAKSYWSSVMARLLTRAGVDVWLVTPNVNPRYSPENCKLLINWGVSVKPIWWHRLPDDCKILNHPAVVGVSVNKVKMMQAFMENSPEHCLRFYTTSDAAQCGIDERNEVIVARTLTQSHSGRGIVLSPPDPLPEARLYTVLKREQGLREYRVFFIDGEKLAVVQKKRKGRTKLLEMATPTEVETWWQSRYRQVVRSWRNGWAFVTRSLDVPASDPVFDEIASEASRIIEWGCVDVLVHTETKRWYFVETNTAPGLKSEATRHMLRDKFADISRNISNIGGN